jgi:hypothetical protein
MSDTSISKQPDAETNAGNDDFDKKATITTEANGNTIITSHGETFIIDRKAERALVWKFDLRILPLLALMYLFNALDKANLGNAATVQIKLPFLVLYHTLLIRRLGLGWFT